ncbi:MAG TPA: hypothetical protein VMW94_02965 [Actinomycetes bacterium]|nr:hypothetical protein [Actinomycetes bacterium]
MSEGVFNVIAFGRQANIATAVAATTLFPADTGFLGFELDRATESPEEDFGSTSREWPGRESHGVRWATASLPFVARFEDIVHALEMHVDTIGTPTGTASPYSWAYTFDETGSLLNTALMPYTIEYGVDGSTQDEWRAVGVIADTLELGFDALSAPGNSMWKGSLGLVAIDREANALTGTATAPTTLETMEGHFTTLAEGATATAFADLVVLSGSLKQFSFSSSLGASGRVYGGTSDEAVAIGRSAKGEVTFDALIGISATSKSDVLDIYNVAGSPATERRWRLTVDGSGVNSMTIDFRCRFRSVNIGDQDGERMYAISGVWVYDSTLGGRGKFTLANAVTTIP